MIRKIIIGPDPKDAMVYFIGMGVTGGKVSAIELDEKEYAVHSRVAYNVFITGDQGTMRWKRIENMPCLLEYDCNF